MRAAVVLLLALGFAGCRSSGRDYTSLNRTSREFLREGIPQARKMRRESLRHTLTFGPRLAENKQRRKESRRFAYRGLFKDEWEETRRMWHGVKREIDFDRERFRASVRFGLLDSGE